MKLKFKIDLRFTSKLLDVHFQPSNKKDTGVRPYRDTNDSYDEALDPDNGPGEDNDPGWYDDDPGEYGDGPCRPNWPLINYK